MSASMNGEKYIAEVVAVLRYIRQRVELSTAEREHIAWAQTQGYSPEAAAYSIESHRLLGEFELPLIVAEDE